LNLLPPVDRKAYRDAIITISIASASDQKIGHAIATVQDHFKSPLRRHARHYAPCLILQGCELFEAAIRVQVHLWCFVLALSPPKCAPDLQSSDWSVEPIPKTDNAAQDPTLTRLRGSMALPECRLRRSFFPG
jgi:hypothetical protein